MPPPVINVPNGAFLEVRFRQRMYGQELLTVLHYKYEQAAGTRTLVQVADDTYNSMTVEDTSPAKAMNAVQSQACDQYAVEVQMVHPTRYAYYSFPGLGQGLKDPAQDIPQNIGVAITKVSDETGRGYTGTVHMGGLPALAQANGFIEPAYKTQLIPFASSLRDVITLDGGGVLYPMIYYRQEPEDSIYATRYRIQDTVRVNRRRTVGLGI